MLNQKAERFAERASPRPGPKYLYNQSSLSGASYTMKGLRSPDCRLVDETTTFGQLTGSSWNGYFSPGPGPGESSPSIDSSSLRPSQPKLSFTKAHDGERIAKVEKEPAKIRSARKPSVTESRVRQVRRKLLKRAKARDVDLKSLFAMFDINNTGELDFLEFKLAMEQLIKLKDHELKSVFWFLDKDRSGAVNYEEVIAFVQDSNVCEAAFMRKERGRAMRDERRRVQEEQQHAQQRLVLARQKRSIQRETQHPPRVSGTETRLGSWIPSHLQRKISRAPTTPGAVGGDGDGASGGTAASTLGQARPDCGFRIHQRGARFFPVSSSASRKGLTAGRASLRAGRTKRKSSRVSTPYTRRRQEAGRASIASRSVASISRRRAQASRGAGNKAAGEKWGAGTRGGTGSPKVRSAWNSSASGTSSAQGPSSDGSSAASAQQHRESAPSVAAASVTEHSTRAKKRPPGRHGAPPDRRRVTVAWLRRQLKKKCIAESRLFNLMDADRSGSITLKEFAHGLELMDVHLETQECRQLFNALDQNGDKRVDMPEVMKFLYPAGAAVGKKNRNRAADPAHDDLEGAPDKASNQMSNDALNQALEEAMQNVMQDEPAECWSCMPSLNT